MIFWKYEKKNLDFVKKNTCLNRSKTIKPLNLVFFSSWNEDLLCNLYQDMLTYATLKTISWTTHPPKTYFLSILQNHNLKIQFDQIHIRKGSETGSTLKSTTKIRSLAGKRLRRNTCGTKNKIKKSMPTLFYFFAMYVIFMNVSL